MLDRQERKHKNHSYRLETYDTRKRYVVSHQHYYRQRTQFFHRIYVPMGGFTGQRESEGHTLSKITVMFTVNSLQKSTFTFSKL